MSEAEKKKSINRLFLLFPLVWGAVGLYLLLWFKPVRVLGVAFMTIAALQFFSILTLTTAAHGKKLKDWQRMLLTVFTAFVAVPNLLWLTMVPLALLVQASGGIAIVLYPLVLFVTALFATWRIMKGRFWARNLLVLFGLFFVTGLCGIVYFSLFGSLGGALLPGLSLAGIVMGFALMLYSLGPSLYLMVSPLVHRT